MSITREQVLGVAELARLALDEAELAAMARSLNAILGYMELLRRADTTGTPAMTDVLPPWDAMRDDEPGATLEPEEWLESVPCRTGPFPMVPRFVEE